VKHHDPWTPHDKEQQHGHPADIGHSIGAFSSQAGIVSIFLSAVEWEALET
jgi:hypothetical protein